MSIGAWILLITVGLSIPGTLVYLLLSFPTSATKSLPTRPVWMVLLDGGVNGRERPDDPRDGLDDGPDTGPTRQTPLLPFDLADHEINRREQGTMPEKAGVDQPSATTYSGASLTQETTH